MSGRLNPREYDFGELRDAVQDMPRRHAPKEFAVENGQISPGGERTVPVDPAQASDPQTGNGESATQASEQSNEGVDEMDTDNVETYLRSRHRARRETIDQPRRKRTSGNKLRTSERSNHQRVRNPDTFFAELSGPNLTKPYLKRLPDTYSAQLEVFKWLDEMLSKAGEDATVSALEYYESIGWLSERSREKLEEITAGLSTPDTAECRLDIDDHRESLLYVARLSHRLNN